MSARGFLLAIVAMIETIRFQFQRFTSAGEVSSRTLVVEAWDRLGRASLLGPLSKRSIAQIAWDIFQSNIRKRFPDVPPGGVVSGGPIQF